MQNWERKLVFTINQLERNEICSAKDNYNISDMCAKQFSESNFNKAVVRISISIFQQIFPNCTYSPKL